MKRTKVRNRILAAVSGALVLGGLAATAYLRVGLLDLPPVPDDLTAARAGLEDFDALGELQLLLDGVASDSGELSSGESRGSRGLLGDPAIRLARSGLAAIRDGETESGLERLEAAVVLNPDNLVLGNTLRMEVFRLHREWRLSADGASGVLPAPPPYLAGRPVEFFRDLAATSPAPEAKLQLAAALLDQMLLTPALEVRVEAMEILAQLLAEDAGGSYYLPALYARGLVYLHRPAHLLWSESIDRALTAARHDLALSVAVGRHLDLGTDLVQGRLALALGDTYAKEGRPDRARSWWQIADAVSASSLRPRVVQRMAWRDDEMIDRLAQVLEHELRDLDQPMSDMSVLWRTTEPFEDSRMAPTEGVGP
jgi:tetratricopeptide (TPR) repeat protein